MPCTSTDGCRRSPSSTVPSPLVGGMMESLIPCTATSGQVMFSRSHRGAAGEVHRAIQEVRPTTPQ
jgi:hypothetical protein